MTARFSILLVLAIGLSLARPVLIRLVPSIKPQLAPFSGGTSYPPTEHRFEFREVGGAVVGLPIITNVQVLDLDGDGKNEVLVCDALGNRILMQKLQPNGSWQESTLIADVSVPAHATVVDIDQDGDLDILVAVLGNIMPDDGVIGRVELFENQNGAYIRHVILENVRRIADVQFGDFNGDGQIDLAVAEFGYARGSVLWLENLGGFKFRSHELLNAPPVPFTFRWETLILTAISTLLRLSLKMRKNCGVLRIMVTELSMPKEFG